TRRSCSTSGAAGIRTRSRCARTSSATSSSPTRARASSTLPTRARCGARSTTCRPTPSPRSSTVSGNRSSTSISPSTPMCVRVCDYVCHASSWYIDNVEDLRIKICIDITAEDFTTIHHELGHNFYQRAYSKLSFLFRDSANDGFHEAVGDTIALSITPEYLVKVGLLDRAPDPSKDVGLLLKKALEKLAFLPFGLLVDQWRWKVFSGEVTPANYNAAWWDLRKRYQGV